ncbi:MAG: HlyD family secretion protein [Janthinobacterium lividum]
MTDPVAAPGPAVEKPAIEKPASVPAPVPAGVSSAWRRARTPLAVCITLAAGLAGGAYWWLHRAPGLPPGIVFSNGRLEADEIDVDTKFAGRVSEIMADEGTMVRAGQVVARIDTRDLRAQLAQAKSQVAQAQHLVAQNAADLVQMGSQLKLTAQELDRARTLSAQGWETREILDQRQSQFNVAVAAYHGTEAKIAAATAGVESATHNAALIQVNIDDNTLIAPKDGPIMYRLANVGEVLPAGGKVFTLLDVTYVYMDIFLPTQTAGRVRLGAEASIVLDAFPTKPIRASVSFLAAGNEFTPKTVETQSERDKLMFRVRVRIDPALLRAHEAEVRSGLPGLAYVRLDATPWPAPLQPVIVE